jgi:DNA-binding NtrC family response regulator
MYAMESIRKSLGLDKGSAVQSLVEKSGMAGGKMKILVVDDEDAMREVLQMRLEQWGYQVCLAADGIDGERAAQAFGPDIVISDIIMPRISGIDLLRLLKSGDPDRPVILVTAQGSIDLAVEAMKQGAQDFITKPLDYPKLKAILEAAERDLGLRRESRGLNLQLEKGAGFGEFVGTSRPMQEVYSLIATIAASDAGVLVTGESGTGKELAARTIHNLSARSRGPFVAINAAAIPENLMESEIFGHERGAFTGAAGMRAGCFELANRGTLMLDEIAEMPMPLQPKLLRVLEDQKVRRLGASQEIVVDVRVIAATNQDPRQALTGGRLREDLYYRLNVFTLALPPLRERKPDIPLLAQHFIHICNGKHHAEVEGLRDGTLELLVHYPWPGNVRELKNTIERAVVLARGKWIEPSHLPAYFLESPAGPSEKVVVTPGATIAEVEKQMILKTLEATGNNKAEAARQLGLDVKTIRNKLKAYGLG